MKNTKKDVREAIASILYLVMRINAISDYMVFFEIHPHVNMLTLRVTTSNYLERVKKIIIYYDWDDSLEQLREANKYLKKLLEEM